MVCVLGRKEGGLRGGLDDELSSDPPKESLKTIPCRRPLGRLLPPIIMAALPPAPGIDLGEVWGDRELTPRTTCGRAPGAVSEISCGVSIGSGVTARMVVCRLALGRNGVRRLLDVVLSLVDGISVEVGRVELWTGRSGRGGATSSLTSGKVLPSISGGSMLDNVSFGHIGANQNCVRWGGSDARLCR